mgnify:CR=1 FL=1
MENDPNYMLVPIKEYEDLKRQGEVFLVNIKDAADKLEAVKGQKQIIEQIAESAIQSLTSKLKTATEALEFYANLEKEYLGNGGLFNPELMHLSGEKLANIFEPARTALASIKEGL